MIQVKLIRGDRNGDSIEVTEAYTEHGVTVPQGFRSDGISVPRFLWRFLSPCITSESVTAGVIHDYIYRELRDKISRATADKIFYRILVGNGFGKFRAFVAWLGVRLFGWIAWRNNEKVKCTGCNMDCRKCWRYAGKDGEK